jgi:hypothetical protein
MATVDLQQLRALVAAVHRPGDRRRVIAVRAEAVWNGVDVIDGEPSVQVVPCPSPLAVRAAVADFVGNGNDSASVLAVLTPCSERDLGPDLLARCIKGRVLSVDPISAAMALFRSTTIDPLLVRERWLIDDLVAIAPPGGWPDERPINGVLDLDLAWSIWQAHRLPGVTPPADVVDLLELGEDTGQARAIEDLPTEHRARLAERWLDGVSPTKALLDRIAVGDGGHLVELGLVAEALWTQTDDPALAALQSVGRARLESFFGRNTTDAAAAARWGAAAHTVLAKHPTVAIIVDRADQTLVNAAAAELAEFSDWLPHGFELRLGRLARTLLAGDIEAATTALHAVEAHQVAIRRSARVEAARAAVQIARWNTEPPAPLPRTFADAVAAYTTDGAWLDDARALIAEGDPLPALAEVYGAQCKAIDARRRGFASRFAELLATWCRSEPIDDEVFVPVEFLLERIAAPIAAAAPILVVVCDGMGLPVAHRLLRDLGIEGWTGAAPIDGGTWPVGIAILPTVTEVSRTSLLTGQRIEGVQPEERGGFGSHPALRSRSAVDRPPVLFHKAQLVGPDGRALPEHVRAAVADPAQRIVGAVVNAVDDHLNRGHQIRVGWDLDSMRPLGWLLDAAAEANRVVIVTADHGYVAHVDGAILRPPTIGGGERWRPSDPSAPPGSDELEFIGPRVLKGGHVVLPADERLRYAGNKYGYHGGATPQEVLVPVAVLARTLPDGWEHRPMAIPAWWTGRPPLPVPSAALPAAPTPTTGRWSGQPRLFEPAPVVGMQRPAPVLPRWTEDLLRAPSFAAHRAQARLPRPIDDDRLTRYLSAIDANGGSIPLTALAERTGEPADQLRMALALVQRLLNLDGAAILTIGADQSVRLDTELLTFQFGVELS